MRECAKLCMKHEVSCPNSDCRQWLNYEEDLNCTLVAIEMNDGKPMTLREIAPRMGVTFPRIKQIEDAALKKLRKRMSDYMD